MAQSAQYPVQKANLAHSTLRVVGITNPSPVRRYEFLFSPHRKIRVVWYKSVGYVRAFTYSNLVSIHLETLPSLRGLITVIIGVSRRRPDVI